jgi:tetratricopeptide (TPR) repeat protein
MPGRRDEAIGMYRRAIALGQRELESNPGDGLLLAQLGYYYGRAGDPEKSRDYLSRAATTPQDGYMVYYATVAAADRGDLEAARRAAAEAVRLGYPQSLLGVDPSLKMLRAGSPSG